MKAIGVLLASLLFMLLWGVPTAIVLYFEKFAPDNVQNSGVGYLFGIILSILGFAVYLDCEKFYKWFKSKIKED